MEVTTDNRENIREGIVRSLHGKNPVILEWGIRRMQIYGLRLHMIP